MVTQLQFTTWPDHGVPDETSGPISFVREVRSYIRSEHGPIVVHCRYVKEQSNALTTYVWTMPTYEVIHPNVGLFKRAVT